MVTDRLHGKLARILALAARTNAEEDVIPRDSQGCRTTKIGLDHSERQIHARRNTRRCPDIAVSHIDRLIIDVHLGPKSTKTIDAIPMRRGASAVEYPRCGKEERATAYRCDARSAQGGLLHELT